MKAELEVTFFKIYINIKTVKRITGIPQGAVLGPILSKVWILHNLSLYRPFYKRKINWKTARLSKGGKLDRQKSYLGVEVTLSIVVQITAFCTIFCRIISNLIHLYYLISIIWQWLKILIWYCLNTNILLKLWIENINHQDKINFHFK